MAPGVDDYLPKEVAHTVCDAQRHIARASMARTVPAEPREDKGDLAWICAFKPNPTSYILSYFQCPAEGCKRIFGGQQSCEKFKKHLFTDHTVSCLAHTAEKLAETKLFLATNGFRICTKHSKVMSYFTKGLSEVFRLPISTVY